MPLSPPAATNLTAAELETEIAANTVSNTVALSLAATIAISVATKIIGATVVASSSAAVAAGAATGAAGAASGGVGGGTASAASGGGGAGCMADVATVLMAVQRLSVLASMPVGMSKIQARVGKTLSWTKGSLGLFPWIVSEETRKQFWGWQPVGDDSGRRLEDGAEAEVTAGKRNEAWFDALMSLIDTLTTLACALASVLLLQLFVHLLWMHLVNRRYYALKQTQQRQIRKSLRGIVAPAQPGSSVSATAAYFSTSSSTIDTSSSVDTASNVGLSLQPSPPPSPPSPPPPPPSASSTGGGESSGSGSGGNGGGGQSSNTPGAGSEGTVGSSHRLSMFEQGRVPESPELPAPRARTRSSRACPEGTPAEPSGVEEEAAVEQGGSRRSPPPLTEAGMAALLHVKFRAFPRLMRWPTAPCLVCVCCMSGLLQGAFAILVTHETVPPHAVAVGAVGATIALSVLLLLWTQLVVFARRHARHMWVHERVPKRPSEVADPALRLMSTVRVRVLTSFSRQHLSPSLAHRSSVRIEKSPALHRARGAFAANGEDAEPRRTERLLANPLSLFPRTALAAYESIAVTVLFKSRGDLKHAMAYHLGQLTAQMLIACLAGVGASLASGGAAALTLVTVSLCVQLLIFLWITCLCPSIDRLANFVAALSWGVEGCSMLLLVLASGFPSLQTGSLQATAYALSLLGVGLPILKLSYEGLFAPLGNLFLRYIDGEARENPCSMGTLLWCLRLMHKLAAPYCACCAGGSGGAATGLTATVTDIADSGVVYGGRDDGNPSGVSHIVAKKYGMRWRDRAAQTRAAREKKQAEARRVARRTSNLYGWNEDDARAGKDRPEREIFSGLHRNRPSTLVDAVEGVAPRAAPAAAPGAASGADRAAVTGAACGTSPSGPAARRETRGRLTLARSPRAQTEPEPPVRV